MIHHRLSTYTEVEALEAHPDEDTICAFIEGRLEEDTSSQMVSHLIVCGSCRRITAQLTRFDSPLNVADDSPLEDAGPGSLRLFLQGLASRMLPEAEEDVVFAYQNPPETINEAVDTSGDEPHQTESSPEPLSHVKEIEPE
jgi:hypothetical protein